MTGIQYETAAHKIVRVLRNAARNTERWIKNMKKILGILMAAIMSVTLAGCSADTHDYQKDANDLSRFVENGNKNLSYQNDVRTAVRGYCEACMQWSKDIESTDNIDAQIYITKQFIEKGNEYLTRIDRLNPSDDEKLFHKKLLEWVDIARELNNGLSELCESANDENKFNAAMSKVDSCADKLDSKLLELANSRDWFKRAVEEYL